MCLYYDLHIHSCLSPCADDDMTPGNICGMAHLKGLDLIAVTDHNSAGNLRAAEKMARDFGIMLIPGMEICTREEVHLLAYFETVEAAEKMAEICRQHLPPMKNRPDFFGHQFMMNERDEIIGEEDAPLIAATDLSFSEACTWARTLKGVPVPAHIYRGNGLVKMLGFIPKEDHIATIEIDRTLPAPKGYHCLHSSDAHRLQDIQERRFFIEAAPCVRSVLDFLGNA